MMKKVILSLAFAAIALSAGAQRVVLKNNVVYDALATPNLGIELGLGRATTLDISGNYNPFEKSSGKMFKHWLIQPEFRYWLCERFNGHFFGLHSGYGEYNISGVRIPFQNKSTQEHRYEGWATGIGISYGYTWILGKRWNLEANIGAGYIYTKYDKYECKTCGRFKGNQKKHYFGPTKAGISLIYIIK